MGEFACPRSPLAGCSSRRRSLFFFLFFLCLCIPQPFVVVVVGASSFSSVPFEPEVKRTIASPDDDAVRTGILECYGQLNGLGWSLVALRFQNLSLPQGANIDVAKLVFTAAADRAFVGNAAIAITAEASISSATFCDGGLPTKTTPASRARIPMPSVYWNNDRALSKCQQFQSPDISPIIHYLANQPSWSPTSNAITIFLHPLGVRNSGDPVVAFSFDTNSSVAAQLVVTQFASIPKYAARVGGSGNSTTGAVAISATTSTSSSSSSSSSSSTSSSTSSSGARSTTSRSTTGFATYPTTGGAATVPTGATIPTGTGGSASTYSVSTTATTARGGPATGSGVVTTNTVNGPPGGSPPKKGDNTNSDNRTTAIIAGATLAGLLALLILAILLFLFVRRNRRKEQQHQAPLASDIPTKPQAVSASPSESKPKESSTPRESTSIPRGDYSKTSSYVPMREIPATGTSAAASAAVAADSRGYTNLADSSGIVPIAAVASAKRTDSSQLMTKEGNGSKVFVAKAKYEIDYSELKLEKQIGSGAFGVVWKASWRMAPCAVKEVRNLSVTEPQIKSFLAEAQLMKSMNPHKNVVQFLGVSRQPLCIVTEYCDKGSLENLLLDPNVEMSVELKVRCCRDIACGMLHLSAEKIIHKDLAARNVLVTENFTCKVADFGLSKLVGDSSSSVVAYRDEVAPLKWLAPETLETRVFNNKTDVWSFGVTIIEIFSRSEPLPHLTIEEFRQTWPIETSKMASYIPSDVPTALKGVMRECFSKQPDERPQFDEICRRLDRMNE